MTKWVYGFGDGAAEGRADMKNLLGGKGAGLAEITEMSIDRAVATVKTWVLNEREQQIAGRVIEEIRNRLEFLTAVGLNYLSLSRSAATLSDSSKRVAKTGLDPGPVERRALTGVFLQRFPNGGDRSG